MSQIPKWLEQIHLKNFSNLLNCVDNPSSQENELTLKMYEEVIPTTEFSNYIYIIFNEWLVDPDRSQHGKGDIVLTNGKDILVVEVKRVKYFSKQIQNQKLKKVQSQARYYAQQIKNFRDKQNFPIIPFNNYFKNSKIYSAYFTNLESKIIVIEFYDSDKQQNIIQKDIAEYQQIFCQLLAEKICEVFKTQLEIYIKQIQSKQL